ncbi:MAG: glycosyltransferase family 4 protein [Deltaproteobacteria bacterium]|nr:glycosyltransferase family 4 protein [Deltaproteobacteria bacterium]
MSRVPVLPRRLAFVGSSLPRQCGIATFTADLAEALGALYKQVEFFAVAMTDPHNAYVYPPAVRFEIAENDLAAYHRAADFLNINGVDLVSLQHEFGLFGGPAGSHVLALLRDLRMPAVTTLHTVLREPDPNQRRVMDELAALSSRVVVMSRRGVELLQDVYGVPPEKIDLIHHGIPDVPFVDPNFYKDKFAVEGRPVLLTFGLLSPNKGIEFAIEALPEVLAAWPDTVYLVVGATHPHLRRREGEAYRLSLSRLARERGVEDHLIFHDRFVSKEELIEFLGAADVYLTPYLSEAQITSGTLAYAAGMGKAVVSTPYWHAQELLAEDRGVLVPFSDGHAIATAAIELLGNDARRHAMRKRAYLMGRAMIWPRVAQAYMESFTQSGAAQHPAAAGRPHARRSEVLPPLNLSHLLRMTDDTGLFQHAIFDVPDRTHGYTTDDNARALLLAMLLEAAGDDTLIQAGHAGRYLSFLAHALDHDTGRFRNFLSFSRQWLEAVGSEDSHGRALWALGTVVGRTGNEGLRGMSSRLFGVSLRRLVEFKSPRAWAFGLLAIHEYLRRLSGDLEVRDTRIALAERLLALHRRVATATWPWFEESLSYCNACLPHALLLCAQWMDRGDMRDVALRSLEWLARIQVSPDGCFAPVGSNGFYTRGKEMARFDQQPVEAHAMLSAALEAHGMTGDERWRTIAESAFDWFLGRNDLRAPVYDPATGGCRDGLHPDRVNRNQGGESTLAFLLSLVEMQLAQSPIREK